MEQIEQGDPKTDAIKTILDLPLDDIIFTYIAPLLDMEDLHTLRMVSHSFATLANRIIGQSSSLHVGCCKEPTSLLGLMYCQNLRTIHFCFTTKVTDAMLVVLLAGNPHVTEFKVIGCINITCDSLYALLKCEKLTNLEISKMVLTDKFLKALTRSNISLQHVAFKFVHGFMGHSLGTFFMKQPNLRSIVLCSLLVFMQPSLQAIGRFCQQLEKITVWMCKGVDDQGILNTAQNCHRLRIFVLSFREPVPAYPSQHPLGPHSQYANVSRDTLIYLENKNITLRNRDPYI